MADSTTNHENGYIEMWLQNVNTLKSYWKKLSKTGFDLVIQDSNFKVKGIDNIQVLLFWVFRDSFLQNTTELIRK